MRIVNLIENTQGHAGCTFAHGLSFYIETEKHKVLMDLGPSGDTLANAEALGIDLKEVDTVVLSHGHYDHSGGIIPFSGINDNAVIYMQKSADRPYYSDDGACRGTERYRYIGIDPLITGLPQVRIVCGDHIIDDEMEIFTIKKRSHELPFSNKDLMVREKGAFIRDDFAHEHFLVVKCEGKRILLSGCAHNGILSILDAYKERYGADPDIVISGFHLKMDREYTDGELSDIRNIASELMGRSSIFYTCHCTGLPAFEAMKDIMGDRLMYVHTGEDIL